MDKTAIEKLWSAYEFELKSYSRQLEYISYNPSRSVLPTPQYAGDLETKLFLLPRKIVFHSVEDLLEPPCPPEIPHPPTEPEISTISLAHGGAYEMGKKLAGLVKSVLADHEHPSQSDFIVPSFVEDARRKKEKLDSKRTEINQHFSQVYNDACSRTAHLHGLIDGTIKPTTEFNEQLLSLANEEIYLPEFLRLEVVFQIDAESKILLIQFKFPDYTNEPLILDEYSRRIKVLPKTKRKEYLKRCLYSMILRYAYIGARYRLGSIYESVALNVEQDWNDPATGQARTGTIASMIAKCSDLEGLDLEHLDPESCFKHLKGISVQSLEKLSPVRPIFVMNKDDERIVESKSVDQTMEEDANIAAMPWEDFEHLVAQLFEWEFSKDGVEVKVTRASRDRGVDAILFDPDPLRGGKYVLQAKRYTRTVDVSAVRDLYGTVMNEGANRGILITTATFGPDTYDFIKDKPLSVVDGPNLLQRLMKHGKKFRIDLEEARRLNNE